MFYDVSSHSRRTAQLHWFFLVRELIPFIKVPFFHLVLWSWGLLFIVRIGKGQNHTRWCQGSTQHAGYQDQDSNNKGLLRQTSSFLHDRLWRKFTKEQGQLFFQTGWLSDEQAVVVNKDPAMEIRKRPQGLTWALKWLVQARTTDSELSLTIPIKDIRIKSTYELLKWLLLSYLGCKLPEQNSAERHPGARESQQMLKETVCSF